MDDVIIVGAGPAGNNLAYRMASLGYSVTVVDWRERIGDKLCTGIVGRECIQQFPLDSSIVFQDARVATVVAPGGEVIDFERHDVQAHVVDRVAYVASFAEMARRAGATYLLGYRATNVSSNGECTSIRCTDDQETRELEGRVLVLASGFGSELTGQLGLRRVGDFVTGVQAEVLAPTVDQIHVYFGRNVAPGFFAWLVPTTGGKALVGLMSRHRGHAYLEQLILNLKEAGTVTEVTKPAARWGVPLRPLARTFGERLLAVGDAAGQTKPTTGGGIYYALLASEIAAETLHDALRRNDLKASRLSYYEKEWKALLSNELEIGYSSRRLFEALRDCQIDYLMHAIASNGIYKDLAESREVSFDWHSGTINRVLGHPVVGKALSFINPLLANLAYHA